MTPEAQTAEKLVTYIPKVWSAGSRHAITVFDESGANVGSYFLGNQRFSANGELRPKELSQAILKFMEPKSLEDLSKRPEYAAAITLLKNTATDSMDASEFKVPDHPKYRVSGWEVNTLGGYALTVWRNSDKKNIGTYFVSQQRFGKNNELSDQEFCTLLLELVSSDTLSKIAAKFNCIRGIEAIKTVASGAPKPMPTTIRENSPASRLDNLSIPPHGLEMARETEIATATILNKAQSRGELIALHSVTLHPLFKQFGSIDHIVIMNHSVWLVNSIRSERRILPHSQKKAMDKFEKLAPLLESHINKMIAPSNPISVKVCLSIWTSEDYNKVSPYALKAQSLVRALVGYDKEIGGSPISRELVARTIATRETWYITPETEIKDGTTQ